MISEKALRVVIAAKHHTIDCQKSYIADTELVGVKLLEGYTLTEIQQAIDELERTGLIERLPYVGNPFTLTELGIKRAKN